MFLERIAAPAPRGQLTFGDIPEARAIALARRLQQIDGVEAKVETEASRRRRMIVQGRLRKAVVAFGIVVTTLSPALLFASCEGSASAFVVGLVTLFLGPLVTVHGLTRRTDPAPPKLQLAARPTLPMTAPDARRIHALIVDGLPEHTREMLGDVAVALQRLADHRQTANASDDDELEMVLEPMPEVLDQLETVARELIQVDRAQGELDEGALVRALFRGDGTMLEALDRVRELEDAHTALSNQLLDSAALARRVVTLGLDVGEDVRRQLPPTTTSLLTE